MEAPEEKKLHHKKAKAKRLQETPEEKEVHLKKLRRKQKVRLHKKL